MSTPNPKEVVKYTRVVETAFAAGQKIVTFGALTSNLMIAYGSRGLGSNDAQPLGYMDSRDGGPKSTRKAGFRIVDKGGAVDVELYLPGPADVLTTKREPGVQTGFNKQVTFTLAKNTSVATAVESILAVLAAGAARSPRTMMKAIWGIDVEHYPLDKNGIPVGPISTKHGSPSAAHKFNSAAALTKVAEAYFRGHLYCGNISLDGWQRAIDLKKLALSKEQRRERILQYAALPFAILWWFPVTFLIDRALLTADHLTAHGLKGVKTLPDRLRKTEVRYL